MKKEEILAIEQEVCSWGDTVHYLNPPKIFRACEGSYFYDEENIPYLDLQMWYSGCNFGYKNERINNAIKDQMDRLGAVGVSFFI